MTVKREQSRTFNASPTEVAPALRAVLAAGQGSYRYFGNEESEGGRSFQTVIQHSQPGILSTKLRVWIEPLGSQSRVTVSTRSQWFLLGDINDFYGDYIRDLFNSIGSRLRNEAEGPDVEKARQERIDLKLRKARGFGRSIGFWGGLLTGLLSLIWFLHRTR